jgi:hypothetical protein
MGEHTPEEGTYLEQTGDDNYIIMDIMFLIKKKEEEYLFLMMSNFYSNHFILSDIFSLLK